MMLSGVSLLPTIASAVDWTGTTGSFGDGLNWSGGIVPAGAPANVANGGTATITTGDSFGVATLTAGGHAGTGTISQDGGALTTGQIIIGGDNNPGGTGVGNYNLSGGSVSAIGSEMWVGSRGGPGTLTMSGASTLTNNNWIIFGRDGSSGTGVIGGTSQLTSTGNNNIGIGVASNGFSSTVTVQDSGKMTATNELYVGWLNSNTNQGVLTVKDSGTVSTGAGLVIGRDNAKGTMTVSDSATVNVGGFLVVGADGGGDGGNGALTVNGSANVNVTQMVWIGQAGNSKGSLTINGGTVVSHANAGQDGTGASVAFRGTNGVLNLNGGSLEATGFNRTGGTTAVNFNGTTIKATGNTNTGSFFNNIPSASLDVQAGGLKLDTNSNNISVTQDLAGVGGISKSGAGTLKLQGVSTFNGASSVTAGTLLNNGTLGATTITVGSGAAFGGTGNGTSILAINAGGQVAPGDGGTGSLTVAAADIDGGLAVEADGTGVGTIDLLTVTGNLDITNATVSFANIGNTLDDPSYIFASYGSLTGGAFFSVPNLPVGYAIDYAFGGNNIALVAIPEPASAMLGGIGLLALFRRRRS